MLATELPVVLNHAGEVVRAMLKSAERMPYLPSVLTVKIVHVHISLMFMLVDI